MPDFITELFSVKSIADITANQLVFIPLVLLFGRAWRWNRKAVTGYLIGSFPIAIIGTPIFIWFLTNVWYPLWGLD